MGINIGNLDINEIYLGSTKITAVYQGNTLIWGGDVPPVEEPFYVTSDEDFTVKLTKYKSPPATPDYSTDQVNWTRMSYDVSYNFSANEKVYIRNTAYSWSSSGPNLAYLGGGCTFKKVGGNVKALLNDSDTMTNTGLSAIFESNTSLQDASELVLPYMTLNTSCYQEMFWGCTALQRGPKLPATVGAGACYRNMFRNCKSLEYLPAIYLTDFLSNTCLWMFGGCTNIKLSTTQTGIYQNEYRLPMSGTGTASSGAFDSMFDSTGGTFKGTPTVNTTYYTSNEVIE